MPSTIMRIDIGFLFFIKIYQHISYEIQDRVESFVLKTFAHNLPFIYIVFEMKKILHWRNNEKNDFVNCNFICNNLS